MNPRSSSARPLALSVLLAAACLAGCGSPPTIILQREPARQAQSSQTSRLPARGPVTVAVLPFARADDPLEPDFSRIRKDGAEHVRRRFERELVDLAAFRVFDRAHLAQIVKTQGLQTGPSFDRRTATRLGKLLAAELALFGKVRRCTDAAQRVGPRGPYAHVADIDFTASLVDLETGNVLWRVSHRGTGRRFLSTRERALEVDIASDRVRENRHRDMASLSDLDHLADVLVKEAMGTLRLE